MNVNEQYRWRERYDGRLNSLKDKSRKPHYHPNQHTEDEIKMIKNYKNNNKDTGLVVLWVKLREAGYTRTVQGLYHVLQRLCACYKNLTFIISCGILVSVTKNMIFCMALYA